MYRPAGRAATCSSGGRHRVTVAIVFLRFFRFLSSSANNGRRGRERLTGNAYGQTVRGQRPVAAFGRHGKTLPGRTTSDVDAAGRTGTAVRRTVRGGPDGAERPVRSETVCGKTGRSSCAATEYNTISFASTEPRANENNDNNNNYSNFRN